MRDVVSSMTLPCCKHWEIYLSKKLKNAITQRGQYASQGGLQIYHVHLSILLNTDILNYTIDLSKVLL